MKQLRIQGWLALAVIATSLWSGTPALASEIGSEVKVVGNQPQPSTAGIDISKDYAVWISQNDSQNGIVLFDLKDYKETIIAADGHPKISPKVDGDYVVWIDQQNGHSDVVLYDIDNKEQRRLTTDASVLSELDISGNRVAWTDARNGGTDIYGFDLKQNKEMRVSTSGRASHLSMDGVYVAWEDTRNGNIDIYYSDFTAAKEQYITLDSKDQKNPYVYAHTIAYQDVENSKSQIYTYNVDSKKTKKTISDSTDNSRLPMLSDDYLVYQVKNDLKFYDVSRDRTYTIETKIVDGIAPRLYDEDVVYVKLDDQKVPRLYLYNLADRETVSMGSQSGDPKQVDASDNYIVYVNEGKKDDSLILYDVKTASSKVISASGQKPDRPLVSNKYVVYFDRDEDALFSYEISTGKRKQLTDDDNSVFNYELSGSKLFWVDEQRNYVLNLTNLASGKTEEIETLKSEPLSIDLSDEYLAWLSDEGNNKALVNVYDVKEKDDLGVMREAVQAEDVRMGKDFVVWSQKNSDSWDMYYYSFYYEKILPVFRKADKDQIHPQASGDLVLFEDNRGSKDDNYNYQLYNVNIDEYVDYEMTEDAEVKDLKLGGNRLVWIDDRDADPAVYTMEVAQPTDDNGGGDDDNPGDDYRDYKLGTLLGNNEWSRLVRDHSAEDIHFIFNANTSNEVEYTLDEIFDNTKEFISLLNNSNLDEVIVRVYE